jgi:hypothetical protein
MTDEPTSVGTKGARTSACLSAERSSQMATMTARATTTAKDSLRISRVAMMSTPSPTPTPIAVGRSRPARLGFATRTCSGGRPAVSSSVGS